MRKRSVFFCYVKDNKASLLILSAMFVLGTIIGIIFINNASDAQKTEIYSYVNSLKENIKISDNINRNVLLVQSIKQNITLVFIIWFLGCTLLGSFLVYVAVIYKGFSIGYTASAIIATLGAKSRWIICVIVIGASELDFYTSYFSIIR